MHIRGRQPIPLDEKARLVRLFRERHRIIARLQQSNSVPYILTSPAQNSRASAFITITFSTRFSCAHAVWVNCVKWTC
jgi:hypothetical protein